MACFMITMSSHSFSPYYEQNWSEVMVQVDKAHFTANEMGCYGGKYQRGINSTNFYDLPCASKDQIAYMWEIDYFKDIGDHETLFSCLNPACKPVFGSWMTGKLGYLNIIAWCTFFVLIACFLFSRQIFSKLSNSQDQVLYHDRESETIYCALSVVTIVGAAALAFWAIPAYPLVFPYTESTLLNDQDVIAGSIATDISSEVLTPDHKWFPVQDVQIL